jgi:hypothetical protein
VTGSHTAIYWQRQILQFPAPRFLQLFRCWSWGWMKLCWKSFRRNVRTQTIIQYWDSTMLVFCNLDGLWKCCEHHDG